MKCYTLNETRIVAGVDVTDFPVDESLSGKKSVKNIKVVILLPERDGIDPDELLSEDIGRASACGKIVFTKADSDTDGRMAVVYDPREWFPDPERGKSSAVVYRSRKLFMAVSLDESFRMLRFNGGGELVMENGKPVVRTGGKKVEKIPRPESGWFLASME